MKVEMDINIEKLRISLVGNGFLKKEVEKLSEDQLIEIFKTRVDSYIEKEYYKSLSICYR